MVQSNQQINNPDTLGVLRKDFDDFLTNKGIPENQRGRVRKAALFLLFYLARAKTTNNFDENIFQTLLQDLEQTGHEVLTLVEQQNDRLTTKAMMMIHQVTRGYAGNFEEHPLIRRSRALTDLMTSLKSFKDGGTTDHLAEILMTYAEEMNVKESIMLDFYGDFQYLASSEG